MVTNDNVYRNVLQVLTALAGGLIASAVGSSVALPSSLIPQVIEEELVENFDTGSWIGQLCCIIFAHYFYFASYKLPVCCNTCQLVWRNHKWFYWATPNCFILLPPPPGGEYHDVPVPQHGLAAHRQGHHLHICLAVLSLGYCANIWVCPSLCTRIPWYNLSIEYPWVMEIFFQGVFPSIFLAGGMFKVDTKFVVSYFLIPCPTSHTSWDTSCTGGPSAGCCACSQSSCVWWWPASRSHPTG